MSARTPMDSWSLAREQANAVEDYGTVARLDAAWENAVDSIEAEGGDSNDDNVVAARALAEVNR